MPSLSTSFHRFLPLLGLTLVAGILHATGQSTRALWLDEACSDYTIREGILPILTGARSAGTPPLYFLFLAVSEAVFGDSEFALRLPSILAATAMVPVAYLVARRYAGDRAGLVAAAVVALSPLVHYYAVEARNYALLQLEIMVCLGCFQQAMARRQDLAAWAWLCVVLVTILYTHNFGVFVLPAVVLAAWVAGYPNRTDAAVRASLAVGLAGILYVPWFLIVLRHSTSGVADWLVPFWEMNPPVLALLGSVEVFGVGGRYPSHLRWLSEAPAFRAGAIALSLLLPVVAVSTWREEDSWERSTRSLRGALAVFVVVPLLVALAYSALVQPVYLVGRYDTIVLPAFLLLYGIGLERLARVRFGWSVAVAALVLAALSYQPAWRSMEPSLNQRSASYLDRFVEPGDLIVATGLRRAEIEYYLGRLGNETALVSYPAEIADHPGWYSAEKLLQDRPRLNQDAEALMVRGQSREFRDRAFWLLESFYPRVNRPLRRRIERRRELDSSLSNPELGIFRYAPR